MQVSCPYLHVRGDRLVLADEGLLGMALGQRGLVVLHLLSKIGHDDYCEGDTGSMETWASRGLGKSGKSGARGPLRVGPPLSFFGVPIYVAISYLCVLKSSHNESKYDKYLSTNRITTYPLEWLCSHRARASALPRRREPPLFTAFQLPRTISVTSPVLSSPPP